MMRIPPHLLRTMLYRSRAQILRSSSSSTQMHAVLRHPQVGDALSRDNPDTVKVELVSTPECKRNDATYLAPVHEGAPTVWRRDGGQRQRGILDRFEMSDQMAAIKPAHRMRHKVDPAPWRLDLQEPVELFRARGDRARARHGSHDDLRADDLAEDAEDARPVLHAQAWRPADVKAVQPCDQVE